MIERVTTTPGVTPDGDGWKVIASGVCPDRLTGPWWLWQRVVHVDTRLPALAAMTTAELEAGVRAFTQD